jgi:GNAT superfamily N-acetyltransferase
MLEVKFYDTVDDSLLKFAVIISQSNGKWVFCKHKERDTYEAPGGHREVGEDILETAKRELQEETGAIVCEIDGKVVASCVCVIIPNLTRNVRPYAFVENVVTHGEYRKKGYATDCLNFAKKIAEENNCYKMMLLTGSKEESTLNFYRNAGYNSSDKTAFIQWIDI